MTIRVGVCRSPNTTKKGKEIGRAVVSLRAILTPGIYEREQRVQVPLVSVTEKYNAVKLTDVGEITMVAVPFMYSEFSPSLHLNLPPKFDKAVAQHYFQRLWRFGRVYDASLLLELHFSVFEKCLQSTEWKYQLVSYLRQLVLRYGPEPAKASIESEERKTEVNTRVTTP